MPYRKDPHTSYTERSDFDSILIIKETLLTAGRIGLGFHLELLNY